MLVIIVWYQKEIFIIFITMEETKQSFHQAPFGRTCASIVSGDSRLCRSAGSCRCHNHDPSCSVSSSHRYSAPSSPLLPPRSSIIVEHGEVDPRVGLCGKGTRCSNDGRWGWRRGVMQGLGAARVAAVRRPLGLGGGSAWVGGLRSGQAGGSRGVARIRKARRAMKQGRGRAYGELDDHERLR